MSDKSCITNNQASSCLGMWRNSRPNNRVCIEMWRNAVSDMEQTNSQSTAQRPSSALSDSDGMRPPSALSNSDVPPPSVLSDSDDMRPPSALSNSDAPLPSALSDDFRLPSPIISDVVSLTQAHHVSDEHRKCETSSIVDHRRSGQDDGCFARELCSRARFSSTLAENGSTVCLASERAVRWVVERERVLNNRVQEAVAATEESLAELLRLVARVRSVGLREVQDEATDSMEQGMKASPASLGRGKVSFTVENHPEDRAPIRPGTPGPNPTTRPDDYFADDEEESPGALRRKTRCCGPSCPAPSSTMLEPPQSPAYALRALKSSEIWNENPPAGPVLHAPVPLRPLRELELLLAGHNSMTETGKKVE